MARYAQGTTVDVSRSQDEVKRMIRSHPKFTSFGTQETEDAAHIVFQLGFSVFRMSVPMPRPDDPQFLTTPQGRRRRSKDQAWRAYQDEYRRRWRALVLSMKAKLTSIDEGITTFEQEFLPYMVTAGDRTVGEILAPRMVEAMDSGSMLALPAPEEA